jgi:hypothetical protein
LTRYIIRFEIIRWDYSETVVEAPDSQSAVDIFFAEFDPNSVAVVESEYSEPNILEVEEIKT